MHVAISTSAGDNRRIFTAVMRFPADPKRTLTAVQNGYASVARCTLSIYCITCFSQYPFNPHQSHIPAQMPIRRARYSDLPTISSILAASFYDEELHAYFFPQRQQYPDEYVRAWYQKVLKCWWDYSRVFVVSYDEAGRGAEVITGVAEWQRVGDGWEGLWGSGRWDPSVCPFAHCYGLTFSPFSYRIILKHAVFE
jgi:hypothetical protein